MTETLPPPERQTITNGSALTVGRLQTRDDAESDRVLGILARRMYVESTQFQDENDAQARLNNRADAKALPEHEKQLAYSTQITECVEYIASQLTSSFTIEATDPVVQDRITKALAASPALSASPDDLDEVSIVQVIRQAAIAGDAAAYVRWDPMGDGTAWAQFWESELVEFVYDDSDIRTIRKVVLRQLVWADTGKDSPEQREEVQTWEMANGECVRSLTYDNETKPVEVEPLGLPFIPWSLMRISADGFRPARGRSIITGQAMRLADRYNATENLSYKIARYNSNATLVMTGDVASLNAQHSKQVNKDVDDVLVLRAGEGAFALTLPTDPQMIEHQREVLLDSLYKSFGLTRVDTSTLSGLGNISGYALEILNRQNDGTFGMLGRQIRMDLRVLMNMMLDVDAYKRNPSTVSLDPALADGQDLLTSVSPRTVYANRAIKISLGTGSVVDVVVMRNNYIAGLTSRRQVLRESGYSADEIKQIEEEIYAERLAEKDLSLTVEGALSANSASRAEAIITGPGATVQSGSTVGTE